MTETHPKIRLETQDMKGAFDLPQPSFLELEPPIRITIPVNPTGQMRVKVVSRPGGDGRNFSRAVKHEKQELREATLGAFLMPFRPDQPIKNPVRFTVICFMKAPKGTPGPDRRFGLTPAEWRQAVEDECLFHTTTPDIDNLAKNIHDCLSQMGFWDDDRLVVESHEWKVYSLNPRWEILIEPVPIVSAVFVSRAMPTAQMEVRSA